MSRRLPVVIDTNVFVAAGFHPRSDAARVLQAVADGRLCMKWTEETRRETRMILKRIPPLSWERVAALFAESGRFDAPTHPEQFGQIVDPDDRKFAALAYRADAVLITQDDDLLSARSNMAVTVETASEFVGHWLQEHPR
jgi:putative PIN family toxin of toxin-antitoxin system